MQKFVTIEKAVGETPLACAEACRAQHPELKDVAMAYAGRLDPMASGKLLILLGDECKNQTDYHSLDKEYEFSVLFGIESDSLDVLGRLNTCSKTKKDAEPLSERVKLGRAARSALGESGPASFAITLENLTGKIELPYPRFSSKTVQGKPLHTWTLEGRLDEIEIPTKESTVYSLELIKTEELDRTAVVEQALDKVNSIPKVTDLRKAIGNDFRRVDVRADWEKIRNDSSLPDTYQIAHFRCIASSGTYMRSLAEVIANQLETCGLAWSIHRTQIGTFDEVSKQWKNKF